MNKFLFVAQILPQSVQDRRNINKETNELSYIYESQASTYVAVT